APQARFELATNARRRQPMVLPLAQRVEGLRRDHRTVRPTRAQPLAEIGLAAPASVRVGGVERRDPGVPRGVEELEGLLTRLAPAEERGRRADAAEVAAAEDDARHLARCARRPRTSARTTSRANASSASSRRRATTAAASSTARRMTSSSERT